MIETSRIETAPGLIPTSSPAPLLDQVPGFPATLVVSRAIARASSRYSTGRSRPTHGSFANLCDSYTLAPMVGRLDIILGEDSPLNRLRHELRQLLRATLSDSTTILVALVVAFLVIGCDSNEPGVRIWCEGVCAAIRRCGRGNTNCAANCVSGEPGLAHLSSSGASALKPVRSFGANDG